MTAETRTTITYEVAWDVLGSSGEITGYVTPVVDLGVRFDAARGNYRERAEKAFAVKVREALKPTGFNIRCVTLWKIFSDEAGMPYDAVESLHFRKDGHVEKLGAREQVRR